MTMNIVSIDARRRLLVIEPRGLDKLWGFVRRIEVPLDQVRGATHDPGVIEDYKGVRGPGLGIPGHKWAGTWRKDGQRHYWNVTGGKPPSSFKPQPNASSACTSASRIPEQQWT